MICPPCEKDVSQPTAALSLSESPLVGGSTGSSHGQTRLSAET